MDNKPIIFILGATASGKSSLGFNLAKKYTLEIISCDSAQVYKGMDIGTAKPSLKEQEEVRHHLIDIVQIDAQYSVSDYVSDFKTIYAKIEKPPLVIGGTGLYVNSLLYDYNFANGINSAEIRKELQYKLNECGAVYLHEQLKKIDPVSANEIHANNTARVIRALEIFYSTGVPKSQSRGKAFEPKYQHIAFALDIERAVLYDRINQRVDGMLSAGLVGEVEAILARGYSRDLRSLQAIGYKEIISYLLGEANYRDAVEKLKQNTRNYAKRQLTWLRHQLPQIKWLKCGEHEDLHSIISDIVLCNK